MIDNEELLAGPVESSNGNCAHQGLFPISAVELPVAKHLIGYAGIVYQSHLH
jgi:hypothetical protein